MTKKNDPSEKVAYKAVTKKDDLGRLERINGIRQRRPSVRFGSVHLTLLSPTPQKSSLVKNVGPWPMINFDVTENR